MKATRRLLFLALAAFLPACGGGGGSGGGGGTPPLPFVVVERFPDDGAMGVVRTAKIYVRMNREPDAGTLLNVVVSDGAITIPRSAALVPGLPRLIAVTPTVPLDKLKTYTVSVNAGLKDEDDGVAATPDTYVFTTSNFDDTAPPNFSGGNFALNARTLTSLTLEWQAATDGVSYEIFILPPSGIFDPTSSPTETVGTLTHTFDPRPSDTLHDLRIRARDAAGNLSPELHSLQTKTLTSWSQDVYAEIIQVRCLLCHQPGGAEVPPFFMETETDAYNRLVNVDAFCDLIPKPKRVLPGNSAASFLYQKINPAPPCGDRMPRDGGTNPLGYLNQTQINTIRDWIDEGAVKN